MSLHVHKERSIELRPVVSSCQRRPFSFLLPCLFFLLCCYYCGLIIKPTTTTKPIDLAYQLTTTNISINSSEPKICVIIRTMSNQRRSFPFLYYSLLSSSHNNFRFDVLNTNKHIEREDNILPLLQSFRDPRIFYSTQSYRPPENDYGYLLTESIRKLLVSTTNCKYFLFTNGDNFYHPDFLPIVIKKLEEGFKVVAVHFWSHHEKMLLNTNFELAGVDLGAVVASEEVVRKVSFTKWANSYYAADWSYISQLVQVSEGNYTVIPQFLYLHL